MNIGKWLFKPIDQTSYGIFRFCLYVSFFIFYHYFYSVNYQMWIQPSHASFYQPTSFFQFLSFDQLVDFGSLNLKLWWSLALLASAIGFLFPLSSFLSFMGFLYFIGISLNFGKIHHSNHMPVMVAGIMAMSMRSGGFSIDHLIRKWMRKPLPMMDQWSLQTIKISMTLVYFSSGFQKLKNSGLSWIFSDNMQSIILTRPTVTPLGLWVGQHEILCQGIALVTLFVELLAPLALFYRGARMILIPMLFLFHITAYLTLGNHAYFFSYELCFLAWLPWERLNRSKLLVFFTKISLRLNFLSPVVAKIYLNVFLPVIEAWLQKKFPDAFSLIPRHSILKSSFNPFLSDIDFTLMVKKGHEEKMPEMVAFFERLHSFSPVFDLPQVYLEDEWHQLSKVEAHHHQRLNFFWNFRKWSWMHQSLKTSDYEVFKKSRALKIIEKDIFKDGAKSPFRIKDLKLNMPSKEGELYCFYSTYLELVNQNKILLCSEKEAQFLQSLLPGEKLHYPLDEDWMNFKKSLWLHEYFLSRSHARVHECSEPVKEKYLEFLRTLEDNFPLIFNEPIPMKGREYDFFR